MDPWKFEDNFQNVCFTGLTARSVPHGTTRANAENAQDRVEVVVTGFHEASPRMAQSASGGWFRSHYAGTVAFGVFTQRGGANATNHNVWVSNVRTMMARTSQFFTSNNLPCYEVLRVSETAGDPDQIEKTDADFTPLTYAVELGVLGSHVA
jgi:hypothetical protein